MLHFPDTCTPLLTAMEITLSEIETTFFSYLSLIPRTSGLRISMTETEKATNTLFSSSWNMGWGKKKGKDSGLVILVRDLQAGQNSTVTLSIRTFLSFPYCNNTCKNSSQTATSKHLLQSQTQNIISKPKTYKVALQYTHTHTHTLHLQCNKFYFKRLSNKHVYI